jgi:nicotinamidase-related amidase
MNKAVNLVFCLLFFMTLSQTNMNAQNSEGSQTALLLIDIQYFYFPGAKQPLLNPEEASLNSQKLLTHFREKEQLVIHVRHNSKTGGEIHENVAPLETEKVISKNSVNSFKETDLFNYLKENEIKKLVICGMMTHMCVEAAVRAASDYGFEVTLIQDACTTRALEFNGRDISAEAVHNSTLASLSGYYANVIDTKKFLKDFI